MWLDGGWLDDCKMYDDFPMQDGGAAKDDEWLDDEWLEALWAEDDAQFSKVQ